MGEWMSSFFIINSRDYRISLYSKILINAKERNTYIYAFL